MVCEMPAQVAQIAMRDLVTPIVRDIESQLKEPLPARVTYRSPPTEFMMGAGEPRGEIRLVCKSLFRPGSFRVFAEAVYRGVAPSTGFSGFKLSGNVRMDGDIARAAEQYTYTIRYNVWEFKDWG
jgi:hypothetical protein